MTFNVEVKPFAVRLTLNNLGISDQVVILIDHIVSLTPWKVNRDGETVERTLVLTSPGITYEVEESIDTILLLISKGDIRR